MKLADTTIGELYSVFSRQEIVQLGKYIQNNYASAANILYKMHLALSESALTGTLPQLDYEYIRREVFSEKSFSTSKLTTYTNNLQRIIKEFVILSKVESKNLYTEVLWSEYLIEKHMKRNLVIRQANSRIDLFSDQYPLQKAYYVSREKLFLRYIESYKRDNLLIFKTIVDLVDSFEDYYINQNFEYYRSLNSFSLKFGISIDEKYKIKISENLKLGKNSSNILLQLNSLMLSLEISDDIENYHHLLGLLKKNIDKLSYELKILISSSLLNYGYLSIGKGNKSFSNELYTLINFCYKNSIYFPNPAQAHTKLVNFLELELIYGTPENAKLLLKKNIDLVSVLQRNSCEKLCIAMIEIADRNYEKAKSYIELGNTNDSVFYYPRFKTMLLKTLIYLKDEVRFTMERENLYKFLHKNKSLGEKNVQSYLKFYKYVDYMNESKFKTLSPYMKEKLSKALEPGSEHFHDKEWMRERMDELRKNSLDD